MQCWRVCRDARHKRHEWAAVPRSPVDLVTGPWRHGFAQRTIHTAVAGARAFGARRAKCAGVRVTHFTAAPRSRVALTKLTACVEVAEVLTIILCQRL